jgi:hypothetical protein
MTNNNQQPPQETPNNQFSNNEPMTFAQKVEYVKSIEMTNNKQQTAVEWLIEELEYKGDLRETPSIRNIQLNIDTSDYMELKVQAKEMEVAGKEMSYDDGYAEGYKRALELVEFAIEQIKTKQ